MKTWHIHIEGRVQGVGFRPFIFRLANQLNLKGDVANTPDGVHIHILAEKPLLDEFIYRTKKEAPAASKISHLNYSLVSGGEYSSFNIVESTSATKPKLLITPDVALCQTCRTELKDSANRRFNYAFTTCTECGPRYSIMRKLPYDRETTSMKPFEMCPTCKTEFKSEDDRRFYSQTNSCLDCGVELRWLTDETDASDHIKHAVKLLHDGKIVAVKGIGGFLLLADASNKKTIKTLRERKKRPSKPFACLFNSIEQVRRFTHVSDKEAACLLGNEAPIVLLKLKRQTREIAVDEIAPGLNRIGAMLPYAPLLELISAKIHVPLVATNANASGSPIVFKDDEAIRLLSGIADAILTNNREITFPQDDSVVLFTPKFEQKILLRRARGFAPSVNFPEGRLPNNVLAMGAEMKSSFAFTSDGNTYSSQFLGDTSTFESQASYEHTLNNLLNLIQPQIDGVAVDAHPNYYSTQKGKEWAEANGVKLCKIQHHKAHFAAVLAEHNLLAQPEPVMGVVWDGLGFGDDAQMWGSEFFLFKNNEMNRIHHLSYFPIISSNRMAKETPIATFAAMWPDSPGKVWLRKRFTDAEQELFPQLAENPQQKTSSMGRLFDATAGLLNCKKRNSFEGEAAMALQNLAEKSKISFWNPYCIALHDDTLNVHYLMLKMDVDKKNQVPKEDIALRFHQTLVQYIALIADFNSVKKVAFSGGVFQNSLLVDMIIERMLPFHELYFPMQLPPNDECIAVGQIAYSAITNRETLPNLSSKSQNEILCV